MQRILGILGGMGPLATVDFMEKIIAATPAHRDQDHVPVITVSLPQIPDRNHAITGRGPSPLAAMVGSLRRLERAGAQAVAIPCNTAHRWYPELVRRTGLPVLHIADAAVDEVCAATPRSGTVGLLATTATRASDMYGARLGQQGFNVVHPDDATQADAVMAGIRAVKGGDLETGGHLLAAAADRLFAAGADTVIMACTEIPIALTAAGRTEANLIDATDALARACVAWASAGEPAREAA